ncbi:MAG TPA: hypothetical protein VMA95_07675 [Streptosporangiaceae bacterium]|nr:hypothetical protein [Streptosporangiaceae bacterium]
MNPPTEQLIRDFLNRLSVAARDELGFTERQSLLDRTRARIEAECGGVDNATAPQVRKVLAGLGDPIAVVERAKVSVISETGGEQVATVDGSEPAGTGLPVSARLVAKGEKNAKDANDKPAKETDSLAEAALLAAPEQAEEEPDETAPDKSGPERRPVPPLGKPASRSVSPPPRAIRSRRGASSEGNKATSPIVLTGGPGGADSSERQRIAAASAVGTGYLMKVMTGFGKLARQNPVEIIAVLLLGLGGVLYPPVWLIGFLIALPSRKWDVRDKFLGLMLPLILVIFGTVLVLAFGGQHSTIGSYGHEAWLGAERICRLTTAGGAVYLLWALRRAKRKPPKEPPWRLSPRFG